MDKINVIGIIIDHFRSFRHQFSGKPNRRDFVLFIILPLILGLTTIPCRFKISENAINILLTSLSVFSALLFNLLLLTYDITKKESPQTHPRKFEFLKEIYSNISFAIVIGLLLITFLLLLLFSPTIFLSMMLTAIIVFLLGLFVLTKLMILKRIYSLLGKEFDTSSALPTTVKKGRKKKSN